MEIKSMRNVSVIVGFKNVPGKSDIDFVSSHGGIVKRTYRIINAISADVPQESIDIIARSQNVEYIENDEKVFAHVPIGTCQEIQILKQEIPWGISRIGSRLVNAVGNTGKGVKVGILDTGIDYNHEDLKGNYRGGYNFVGNNDNPMDDNGHGTHVAGIVAAEDNDIGVVGVAPQAYLYSVKVLAFDSTGSTSDIVSGLEWSVDNSMHIINMSLGSDDNSISVGRAINNTYNAGILIVAAAGNSGNASGSGNNMDYPSLYDSVVSVGATDINDNRAKFSSTGPKLELSAPGVNILSTLNGNKNKYGTLSGTCLTGDSLVISEDGVPVNISNLIEGNMVISWNNGKVVKNKVLRVIKNGKKPVYLLKLKGRYIKCTNNHPFLVADYKNNEYIWRELKDINVGDYVWCLNKLDCNYPVSFSNVIKDVYSNLYFVLTEKGQGKIVSDRYWYTNLRIRNYFSTHTPYSEGTIRGLVKMRNGMRLGEIAKLFEFIGLKLESDDYVISGKYGTKNIVLPTEPDEKFCKLFGYMIGDGWTSPSDSGTNQVCLAVGYDNDGINESDLEYVSLFEDVFNTELKDYDKSSLFYYCYSAQINEYLIRLGLNKCADEKEIPGWIFKLSRDLKIKFVEGLMDADGYIIDKGKTVGIELSSKKLIDGLTILCSEIGFEVSRIGNREREYCFWRKNGNVDSGIADCYSVVIKYNNNSSKEFLSLEVKSIEYYGEEDTYDIEIENSHNFISNGIVVHNSMSSPHVTGVAALIMSNEKGITNSRVRIRMQMTAQNMSKVTGGFSAKDWYGYGLVDAVRSVSL